MKIREMELLIRVAETGSMTRAARQLHVTPAAVSAAVQRLEEALGVRVFERTTRSLTPTEDGEVLLEGCRAVVDRWRETVEDVTAERNGLSGTVQLSAPSDTTYTLVQDVAARLATEHPALEIELHTSDAVAHLHRDGIDMAVRYGPLPDSTLAARKLVDTPGVLVASPEYVAEHGEPRTPAALADHRALTLRRAGVPMSTWTLDGPEGAVDVGLGARLCGDGYLARRWAVAGHGIAYKSLLDVVDDLEAGRLVRVLPAYTLGVWPIHAVFPSRRYLPARVRALDAAVAAAFAERDARCQAWLAAQG